MRVLFISPEMEPLAKVGGLADVVGALPGELKKLGCDVRVVIPFYRHVKDNLEKLGLKANNLEKGVIVCLDWLPFKGEVSELSLDGVLICLLDNEIFFDREYIYTTPQGDYQDNDLRFGFLSLGALEIAKTLNFKPDIIHCHDWQTSFAPISLKWRRHLKNDPFFKDSKVVFTIHNIAYQGLFPLDTLDKFGLPWFMFTPQGLEFYGKLNLLKGGILYSDLITTVSPTYAEEIKTPQYGYGLDGVLRAISDSNKLFGILNGIDYEAWNPKTDKALYMNYSADSISYRQKNKLKLGQELGLNIEDGKPLLGIVSRLVEQKGIDVVVESLSQIFDLGFQMVILGSGEEKYERMLENARQRYKENLSLVLGFDDTLARRIYAGSDMFLMPSRFEPCGIGQMIALRYGSIPVVRGTGGLLDTVRDYTADRERGNGFIFHEFSKVGFLDALIRSLAVYENPEEWANLIKRAMGGDFSWKRSSERYQELYEKLIVHGS
ncbi:MAG TPA: glycogen synthase GlgA [Thermodesulfobacteriota bacterium]|nr:glycogen synthase GlgA [Thermodesulfobacteriota bacterium]